MAGSQQFVEVGGHRIRVSNLDKVLYPSTGTTKGDVIGYYSEIAPVLLPHTRDRAATRKRWPDGVGEDGSASFFFQKDIGEGAPEWVETREVQHKDHANHYPLVNDEATLVWLAQLATLEIHVPQWRFGTGPEQLNPDRLVLDLDPGPGVELRQCAEIAVLVRDILRDMGLPSVPVTSGSKGIHLYAALDGTVSSDGASKIARELARALEADHPDDVISSMKRSLRDGKVFIDWSQNNASKTTVAPYSLRGRVTPTVAVPRTWRELASPHLKQLDFREALRRVAKRGDPMSELTEASTGRGAQPQRDRLEVYRSKRDPKATPEPVPERGAGRGSSGSRGASGAGRGRASRRSKGAEDDGADADGSGHPVFVIQRHDARRLHHDFRLEHDGVLVSWALPKGVPTDPKRNHLAVPTEDHPMEYRFFEGTIPKGEYGAGEVEIWDSGTYECEKWRDDEVIAVLHGRPNGGLGGTRRFALFRAGERDGKAQWMIHLMDREDESGAGRAPGAVERGRGGAKREPNGVKRGASGAKPRGRDERADPARLSPMLATRGELAELHRLDGEDWAFEMKWDGMRALAVVDGSSVRILSRSGHDVTASYPELQTLGDAVSADDAVLDGEIVAFDAHGAPSFARLQLRMGVTDEREVRRAMREAPASLLLFDVLAVNGQDCRSLPYRQRRELLAELLPEEFGAEAASDSRVPVGVPEAFDGDAEDAAAASRELGLEGLVAKRWSSVYRSGVRSPDWVKFPSIETAEVVVVGWRASEAEPSGLASVHVAFSEGGELRYAGRVGTGFGSAERRSIRARLERLERKTPAVEVPKQYRQEAHWVTPKLVAEVVYRGETGDGRLRHASWRGWRPDKSVEDVN